MLLFSSNIVLLEIKAFDGSSGMRKHASDWIGTLDQCHIPLEHAMLKFCFDAVIYWLECKQFIYH
jgi:hypothetical protein